jgi:hypothetical protein
MARRNIHSLTVEYLYDELEAATARWRLERALLLDRLDQQRDEIARLKAYVANKRAELSRYTASQVISRNHLGRAA